MNLIPIFSCGCLDSCTIFTFRSVSSISSSSGVRILTFTPNAKIINQQADGRVDTTQGIDITNRLIATELINAINLITISNDLPSHLSQQAIRVTVDNQAICTSIATASKAVCSFTINIHK